MTLLGKNKCFAKSYVDEPELFNYDIEAEKFFKPVFKKKYGIIQPTPQNVLKNVFLYDTDKEDWKDLSSYQQQCLTLAVEWVTNQLKMFNWQWKEYDSLDEVIFKPSKSIGFIEDLPSTLSLGEFVEQHRDRILDYIKLGHIYQDPVFWSFTGKKELLPQKKINENNIRIFMNSPADYRMASMFYLQGMTKAFYDINRTHPESPWAPGISLKGGGSRELRAQLQGCELIYVGDCAKWDKNVSRLLIKLYRGIVGTFYVGSNPNIERILDWYLIDAPCYNYATLGTGSVFKMNGHGVYSGRVDTTVMNTIIHAIVLAYAYIRIINGTFSEYMRDVKPKLYSDDHIIGLMKGALKMANYELRRDVYAELGLKLDPDKDKVHPNIFGLDFLGFTYTRHGPIPDFDKCVNAIVIPETRDKQTEMSDRFSRATAMMIDNRYSPNFDIFRRWALICYRDCLKLGLPVGSLHSVDEIDRIWTGWESILLKGMDVTNHTKEALDHKRIAEEFRDNAKSVRDRKGFFQNNEMLENYALESDRKANDHNMQYEHHRDVAAMEFAKPRKTVEPEPKGRFDDSGVPPVKEDKPKQKEEPAQQIADADKEKPATLTNKGSEQGGKINLDGSMDVQPGKVRGSISELFRYGNYCGLKYGDNSYAISPIDILDKLCQEHDKAYDEAKEDPKMLARADQRFVSDIRKNMPKMGWRESVVAYLATLVFSNKDIEPDEKLLDNAMEIVDSNPKTKSMITRVLSMHRRGPTTKQALLLKRRLRLTKMSKNKNKGNSKNKKTSRKKKQGKKKNPSNKRDKQKSIVKVINRIAPIPQVPMMKPRKRMSMARTLTVPFDILINSVSLAAISVGSVIVDDLFFPDKYLNSVLEKSIPFYQAYTVKNLKYDVVSTNNQSTSGSYIHGLFHDPAVDLQSGLALIQQMRNSPGTIEKQVFVSSSVSYKPRPGDFARNFACELVDNSVISKRQSIPARYVFAIAGATSVATSWEVYVRGTVVFSNPLSNAISPWCLDFTTTSLAPSTCLAGFSSMNARYPTLALANYLGVTFSNQNIGLNVKASYTFFMYVKVGSTLASLAMTPTITSGNGTVTKVEEVFSATVYSIRVNVTITQVPAVVNFTLAGTGSWTAGNFEGTIMQHAQGVYPTLINSVEPRGSDLQTEIQQLRDELKRLSTRAYSVIRKPLTPRTMEDEREIELNN